MGAGTSDLGRSLREQRRARGLTRSRLAERTGISSLDLTRWERGEAVPDSRQVIALAEAVGFSEAETRRWLDAATTVDLTGPEVAVELESPDASADPFAATPGSILERSQPSLIGRLFRPQRAEVHRAHEPEPFGHGSVTELRPTRRPVSSRPTPSTTSGLVRQPRGVPSQLPSVFPDPPMVDYDPAVHVYSTAPSAYPGPGDADRYLLRRIRTTGVLLGLAVVLWWAFGSLWEGLGEMLELFSGGPTP